MASLKWTREHRLVASRRRERVLHCLVRSGNLGIILFRGVFLLWERG
jgi:hypothetical protein